MEIATPRLSPVTSLSEHYNSLPFLGRQSLTISMSQDYTFSFSNGFEGSQQEQQQHHITQQIRRDKLRVQGYEPPRPFVGTEEEESAVLPVYETAGMLSEMFSFPSGAAASATELLESQILQSYRNTRGGAAAADWFSQRQEMMVGGDLGGSKNQSVVNESAANHHHQQHQISSINAESAAAMQLFLMDPQKPRSPSPSPSHPHPPHSTSCTFHMLLPHHSSPSTPLHGGSYGQFTWLPNSGNDIIPSEIPGVVEGQGLSLSLSSSLKHLEAEKVDELRMGEGNILFFGHGAGSTPAQFQGGVGQNHQMQVGFASSSYGAVHMLRNSKYVMAAQDLLEEFCSVGRGQFKKNKLQRLNDPDENPSSNPTGGGGPAGAGNSSSSSKDNPPLSAAERLEHQRRKVKLLSMLDEVDRRYSHYCQQMQMVVNSFDMVMGFGAAVPYTSLAQKAMSRHFRCLKDSITAQLKHSCERLGEKDAGASGVTKGETPRLKRLDQGLRQQRAFHQMGMMEQEAWRPQRGLPERSVNILRAWLFEHFLHPYPSDADKHLLGRQAGLSRNQVSNWFINARVRLWKPMVEEMYQQEAKDESGNEQDRDQSCGGAQTPTPPATTASATAITTPPPPKRSENTAVQDNDPSFTAINRHCLTDNQVKQQQLQPTNNVPAATSSSCAPRSFAAVHEAEACRDQPTNPDIGSTLIRLGTTAGDVSLTLGLRHAGNLPEKSPFSIRDFGGC